LQIDSSIADSFQQSLTPEPAIAVEEVKALEQLLRLVAEGEQDQAEAMIKSNWRLLLSRGQVTDLSGRTFEGITAFQYALWAMDWHMWKMIQKYLPPEAQSEQFDQLDLKGTVHGKHFSLKPLMDALQIRADKFDSWDWSQRDSHWCTVVGGAQKELAVHVVNEYCRNDQAFSPCPTEWESTLPRTRELEIYNSTQSEWVKSSWFVSPSVDCKDALGVNFANIRCWQSRCSSAGRGFAGHSRYRADLRALQSLWKVRTKQLERLNYNLKQKPLVT
jgi:hypothetical protein